MIITRFAPSPSGRLHLGGARTALFNWLFAKHNKGKFLIRMEDTDELRTKSEFIDSIQSDLTWLGLEHDKNIILQSQNRKQHVEVVKSLINNNTAYYCYCEQEELKKDYKTRKLHKYNCPFRDDRILPNSEKKPVVRFKTPLSGKIQLSDMVQGDYETNLKEVDDFIILRNDSSPTYMLAAVVDDYNMGVTHVIRGTDHLSNTVKQVLIYQSMNWELVPKFSHIPLIHNIDGKKMSKRNSETSVSTYRKLGILPQAMMNYLLRLGWSHKNLEIIDQKTAIELFSINKIGKSPARFDINKLYNLNKHYISRSSTEDLISQINIISSTKIINDNLTRKAIDFLKTREKSLLSMEALLGIYRYNSDFPNNMHIDRTLLKKLRMN